MIGLINASQYVNFLASIIGIVVLAMDIDNEPHGIDGYEYALRVVVIILIISNIVGILLYDYFHNLYWPLVGDNNCARWFYCIKISIDIIMLFVGSIVVFYFNLQKFYAGESLSVFCGIFIIYQLLMAGAVIIIILCYAIYPLTCWNNVMLTLYGIHPHDVQPCTGFYKRTSPLYEVLM